MSFPTKVDKVKVPPIKCQGIKTRLIPFIFENIKWDSNGRWIEPFLGSGVVLFNANPKRAIVADTNIHIIHLYKGIQRNEITPERVRDYLESEGKQLLESNGEHYYKIRERFNKELSPLDFLFLNRSCFNGMIRFNQKGYFNISFCRKPERFRPAYITKIVNQVSWVANVMKGKDWTFVCQDWRETLKECYKNDFVYMDPPYNDRYADYYNKWTKEDSIELLEQSKELPCGYALSMWYENQYRRNSYIEEWDGILKTKEHFYHVGAHESNRNSIVEGLVIKEGYCNIPIANLKEKQLLSVGG